MADSDEMQAGSPAEDVEESDAGNEVEEDDDQEEYSESPSSNEDEQDDEDQEEHNESSSSSGDEGPDYYPPSEIDDEYAREPVPEIIEKHLKAKLEKNLGKVAESSKGDFSTMGVLTDAPNPGLDVVGVGPIGLPLSRQDANRIKGVCHQAPYGMGGETLVDESVRKTWEVNGGEFEFKNPRWQSTVDEIRRKVLSELGLPGMNARVHLYKLLLYEQGAFFKKHRDSEKAPGMFATLVICLPSKHEGGNVVTTFKDKSKTLSTSGSSLFDVSYLAWYADIEHEVEPIISGHRLVLTYNIIHEAGSARSLPSAAGLNSIGDNLTKLMSR